MEKKYGLDEAYIYSLALMENKNRTDKWLKALGVQFPSALTKYGSINSISTNFQNVNNNNKNSSRDSEYLELAKEPEKNRDKLQQMVDEAYIYSLALRDNKRIKASPTTGQQNAPAYNVGNALSNTTIPQNAQGVNSNSMQNGENNSEKFSSRDTEYLELAKDPEKNRDKLQEMVDEAAEEAFVNSSKKFKAQKNTANVESGKGYTIYFSERENTFESKVIVDTINKNINRISPELRFDVNSDSNAFSYTKKSEYVLDIFNKQGNLAYNPEIGYVDLTKSGAKSTISHGYGKVKLAAVKAIKNVIEEGNIISFTENYNDSNVDRYIIAAKGKIDGAESYIGVVIKSYPQNKANNKFYLHEAKIIEANSPVLTAPQLSVDTVGESASSNTTISQNSSGVNSNSMQNGENNSDNSNTTNSLRDTEYLELAKEPEKNKDKLQAMVDEAARENGYNSPKVYHGTLTKGIHKFSKEFIGSRFSFDEVGFFFIDRKSIAEDYAISEFDANKKGEVISAYLKVNNPLVFNSGFAIKNGYGNVFRDNDCIDVWDAYQGAILDEIENKKSIDGIIINDGNSRMYVVFEPNQIKSADPVTYDDDGNIIPLSERFNDSENDIRFSSWKQRIFS